MAWNLKRIYALRLRECSREATLPAPREASVLSMGYEEWRLKWRHPQGNDEDGLARFGVRFFGFRCSGQVSPPTTVQGPPRCQDCAGFLASTGSRNVRKLPITAMSEAGAAPRRSRVTNACHCVCFSPAKSSLSPTGVVSGQGVLRCAKVCWKADASDATSNANDWAILPGRPRLKQVFINSIHQRSK